MILRRFMEHVKDQNWFAVGLDVLVVIVGIFLGTQATDWNEQRHEQEKAVRYMSRIREDLQTDLFNLEWQNAFWHEVYDYGVVALEYEKKGELKNNSKWQTLLAFFQASQIAPYAPIMVTYSEMKSEGALGLIENIELRNNLARYYGFTSAAQADYIMRILPKYREIIRTLFDADVTAYIWSNCHVLSDLNIQAFIDCDEPPFPIDYDRLFKRILDHPQVTNELRSWTSTQQVKFTLVTTNVSYVNNLIETINSEIDQKSH